MDDLLLSTPTNKSHMSKSEDSLKALLKNGLKSSPKNVSSLEKNYNIWEIPYSLKIREYESNHCKVG